MAKRGKHQAPEERKIIRLQDYRRGGARPAVETPEREEPQPSQEPPREEGEEQPQATLEVEETEGEKKRRQQRKVPQAVYRVALILLALILVLALWLNRANLNPENLLNWAKLQLTGEEVGDGFPVNFTGSQVQSGNFTVYNGGPLALSDTTLNLFSASGAQELALRHSLHNPVLCQSGSRFLLYNNGSTGYMTLSGPGVSVQGAEERAILAGAIAQNGKFALGVQGADGASELHVYQSDPDLDGEGELQYQYLFAKDYITAVAFNYDGTFGAVATVHSQGGEMVSRLTVFDFNQPEPVATYETGNNLLLGVYWGENGTIYAVGDSALVRGDSGAYEFSEYSYQGRQLTAYRLSDSRAFLSLSAYEHAGPSTLLTFHGLGDPVAAELEDRIEAISVYGGAAGLLVDGQVVLVDYSSGTETGRAQAGLDARGLALSSESEGYVLGGSEIRKFQGS